jgi:predicted P-loop ATPase
VNHSSYLRDETGARRFWPVACGSINIDRLARDRDQLWAEAVALFRNGQPWWLDSSELIGLATSEQADRFESDPWEESIATFLENRADVSIDQILRSLMEKPLLGWSQADMNRIVRVLRSLGWERFNARTGTSREWRYRHVTR